ncbi:hypothetical protein TH5_02315 [Thalassospira xianhensis MCCC 1A02616]|uniref:Uncharacterized protein n=2 Tax=Thalassospira xianhensis TaxID=478503 RepID=A0A367UHT5_9PROT|nr:hypothetical protein TH5_02315 [Thalassospira xianhensis MCCC 1A02616]
MDMSAKSLDTPDAVLKSPSVQPSGTPEDVSGENNDDEIEADGFITVDLPGISLPLPKVSNHV